LALSCRSVQPVECLHVFARRLDCKPEASSNVMRSTLVTCMSFHGAGGILSRLLENLVVEALT
jgi:hypothetical protein